MPSDSSAIDDPKHWRDRAAAARALAEQISDELSKRMMRRIADDYELLAQRAESRSMTGSTDMNE
jgi:hypothetical protein